MIESKKEKQVATVALFNEIIESIKKYDGADAVSSLLMAVHAQIGTGDFCDLLAGRVSGMQMYSHGRDCLG